MRLIIKTKIETKSQTKWETAKNEEDDNMEERDLLDILVRSQSDEGGILSKEELADQTKTYEERRRIKRKDKRKKVERKKKEFDFFFF